MLRVSDPANVAYRDLWNIAGSPRLDVCCSDNLAPLLREFDDELAKIGVRVGEHCAAQIGYLLLHLWIGEASIDRSVEFVDDFCRCVPRCDNSDPSACL